jgi:hypothetical protein
VTAADLDSRLQWLKAELDEHARIAQYFGLDFDRPIRSLGDGYVENAVACIGKIAERLLKRLWRHYLLPGTPLRTPPPRRQPAARLSPMTSAGRRPVIGELGQIIVSNWSGAAARLAAKGRSIDLAVD